MKKSNIIWLVLLCIMLVVQVVYVAFVIVDLTDNNPIESVGLTSGTTAGKVSQSADLENYLNDSFTLDVTNFQRLRDCHHTGTVNYTGTAASYYVYGSLGFKGNYLSAGSYTLILSDFAKINIACKIQLVVYNLDGTTSYYLVNSYFEGGTQRYAFTTSIPTYIGRVLFYFEAGSTSGIVNLDGYIDFFNYELYEYNRLRNYHHVGNVDYFNGINYYYYHYGRYNYSEGLILPAGNYTLELTNYPDYSAYNCLIQVHVFSSDGVRVAKVNSAFSGGSQSYTFNLAGQANLSLIQFSFGGDSYNDDLFIDGFLNLTSNDLSIIGYFNGLDAGYSKGYDYGYDEGFMDGFGNGRDSGYNSGYDEGYTDALTDEYTAYDLSMRSFNSSLSTVTYSYNQSADVVQFYVPSKAGLTDTLGFWPLYRFLGGVTYTVEWKTFYAYCTILPTITSETAWTYPMDFYIRFFYLDGTTNTQKLFTATNTVSGGSTKFTSPSTDIQSFSYAEIYVLIPSTTSTFGMNLSGLKISSDSPYALGYGKGYTAGLSDADDTYRQDAYNDGFSAGVGPVSWFSAIASGFASFFEIQLFPGVSLSVVLAIILVPVLIGFLLKVMKGFE